MAAEGEQERRPGLSESQKQAVCGCEPGWWALDGPKWARSGSVKTKKHEDWGGWIL